MAVAQLREGGESQRASSRDNLAAQIATMNNATSRQNSDQANKATLRGQDITYAGHMAPLQYQQALRAQSAQAYQAIGAGGKDGTAPITPEMHRQVGDILKARGLHEEGDKAYAAAASGQALTKARDELTSSRAADTEKVFKPLFTREVKDAQGNVKQEFDDVGAAKAAATVRGIYGEKFDKLTPDQKRSAYVEIAAKQKNMDAERQVMPGFIDRVKDLVGMYQEPAPVNAPRDLRGGVPERAGLISPWGVNRNNTLVRLPNGKTIDYGKVDADQLADINNRLRQ